MAPRWRWLLVALTAVTIGCVAPGSLLSRPPPALGATASIEPAAPGPAPGTSECAAVACNRGSSASPGLPPGLAVAGTLAAGAAIVLAAGRIRRRRPLAGALPTGVPRPLLHPPQLAPFTA